MRCDVISRLSQIAVWMAAFVPLAVVAQDSGIKLDAGFFQKLEPMRMASNSRAFPEWQEITIGFRDHESVKLLFPARTIVERLTAGLPDARAHVLSISFDQIEIGLFRSTSYFSLIYNVRVTLTKRAEENSQWFFISSFRGKGRAGFLKSIEAQQQICSAIINCLNKIEQSGGFRP